MTTFLRLSLCASALLLAPSLRAADPITVLSGFKVEQIHKTDMKTQGSWVSLCVDDKGELLASDQYGYIWRIVPPAIGKTEGAKVTKVNVAAGKAHGLLWAYGSLYIMGSDKPGEPAGDMRTLWRAWDSKGDGTFDKVQRIASFEAPGEHGPHALVLGPNGQKIYFACGNHTPPPTFDRSRAPQVYQEDHLLPRMWDANGHARGIMAPGGFIARCNLDGTSLELVSMGYRNEYDFAFNQNGEMFTYDADMEWDLGLPWYRPTRICHATSGSEFGWRSGSGKWPTYYEDSLPGVLDIGPGSPTGVVFGTGAKFPAKYQHAMFGMDWSFGTMYAIHFKAKGATYSAEKEVFLSGQSLPLSDLIVRPQDGALYFTTGGRKTESALYRVTYTGSEATTAAPLPDLSDLAKLRRQIEGHHHPNDPEAVNFCWPHLDHADRFIRFAARVAIENQPIEQWQAKALAETRPNSLRELVIAMARLSPDKALAPKLVDRLLTQKWEPLDTAARLQWLRACSLVFLRLGEPDEPVRLKLLDTLDAAFPTSDDQVNRELGNLLIYLKSPTIVSKAVEQMYSAVDFIEPAFGDDLLARGGTYGATIADMQKQPSHKQQIHFAFNLRAATVGWTPELTDKYFAWFGPARTFKGGNSFAGFLRNARDEGLARITDPLQKERLLAMALNNSEQPIEIPHPKGPGANYTVADFSGVKVDELRKRDISHGKEMFQAALCAQCHRFGGEFGGNGAGGPDLTGAGARYTVADLVTAIIDPNKEVSDQYAFTEYNTIAGEKLLGRVARDDEKNLYLITSFLAPEALTPLPKRYIKTQEVSKVSPMIPGLLNALNKEEVLDLLGFLMTEPK